MAHSLKDLLVNAIQRANISREVDAAQIVLETNRFFDANLHGPVMQDVKAISYRDHVVTVGCLNSSASQFIAQMEEAVINHIKKALPSSNVSKLQTRVIKTFPSSEL